MKTLIYTFARMENEMIDEETKVYFVVMVNGIQVSPMFEEKMLAEMEKAKLSPDKRELAEVVVMTKQGQQLLLG